MQDIIVISDIHIAKKWDELENVFPKTIKYLNPNKYLRKVISSIKTTDAVVFNGDLIDYYYCDYFNENENNWDIFLNIIKKSKGKCFLNFGNHDYRKKPYNFDMYGLKHVNVDNATRKLYAKIIGFNRFRFFDELESINVNLKRFNPIPKKLSNSSKNFKTSKSEVVMLNTGPDALTKITQLFNPFNWTSILSTHPPSLGISDKEIQFLKNIVSKEDERELIIFLHCPPFFSMGNITPIKLSKIIYPFSLLVHKLTYVTFTKNNWEFIDLLLKSHRNIIVITSHCHMTPKQYLLNKKNRILKQSSIEEINTTREQHNFVKFISTLPLGAIQLPNNVIGYVRIGEDKIEYKVLEEFSEIAH